MKLLPTWALMAFVVIGLFGCGTTRDVVREPVTTVTTQVAVIPDQMFETCKATQPPEKAAYIEASEAKRAQMLTIYSMMLLKNVKDCDNRLQAIKALQLKYLEIYKPATPPGGMDHFFDKGR